MSHNDPLAGPALVLLLAAAMPAAEREFPVGFSAVGEIAPGVQGADPEVGTRLTKAGAFCVYRPAVTAPAQVAISVYRVIEANRLSEEGAIPKQRYEIHHQGKIDNVDLDFSGASSWASLGTFTFAGTGQEYLTVRGRTAEIKFTVLATDGKTPLRSTVIAPPPANPRPRAPALGALPKTDTSVGTPPRPVMEPATTVTALKLPPHISDHMIFQRGRNIIITGQAPAGAAITVAMNGKTGTATARNGVFQAVLPAMPEGGPYALTISGAGETKTINDVVVGDIWIVAGQSNMAFATAGLEDNKQVLSDAEYPQLRLYMQNGGGEPTSRYPARWQPCTAKVAAGFTAVGFLFARGIHQALHVPVGIMYVVRDGGDIRLFMRDDVLASLTPDVPYKYGPKPKTTLFSDFLEPLIGFPITGLVYYQGEGNQKEPYNYRKLLPAMVQDVRALWGQGNFPFIIVQLPRYKDSFVGVREAQFLAAQTIPNVALVTTIDTGGPKALHPPDKRLIGDRAAQAALGLAYHQVGEHEGPQFAEAKSIGNRLLLRFLHTGTGLEARGTLDGFLLAGEEGDLAPARAEIAGPDTVAVWREDVAKPVTARYLWNGAPRACLYNREGFPASPFRTDAIQFNRTYDNNDACMSRRGEWTLQKLSGMFGSDALVVTDTRATEGDSDWTPWAKWTLEVEKSGTYELYLRWPEGLPATAEVTIEVNAGGAGYPHQVLSQASGGGQWRKLGTYPLNYGNGDSVKLLATGLGGTVDALRMEAVESR